MSIAQERIDIKRLAPEVLAALLAEEGLRPFRTGQILRWVYQRQADSFDVMTDLSKSIRQRLGQRFAIPRLETVRVDTSADGSRKFLFRLSDGEHVESVLIPERGHSTLCVSSQVGCAQGCRFCLTAKGGLIRNLDRGEIIDQVRDVQRAAGAHLTNIVLMGMGEPLANYRQVVSALRTLVDNETGFGFASRRITLSTAGLVPQLKRLGRDIPVNLAVSLNAVDNETRSLLMPINRRYPLEALIDACRRYPLRSGRRITFEYILIAGLNDRPLHAGRLARLLRGLRAKINLIPFNPHDASDFKPPEEPVIEAFQQRLMRHHYTTIVRRSKGSDISAACGQLRARLGLGGQPFTP
jgi:23S rRNA (adenine2503-C2)-methyltransferase